METLKCGAYIVTHKDGVYVGSTKNLPKRELEHRNMLSAGIHHCKSFQKAYDRDPRIEFTMFPNADREDAYNREEALLELYRGRTFNTAIDVRNPAKGLKHSPESIERMRIAKLGKTLSEEHKQKIGRANIGVNKGKIRSPETRALLHQCRLEQAKAVVVEGIFYESILAAASAYGINPGTASSRIRSTTELFQNWTYATPTDKNRSMEFLQPKITAAPPVKMMINIGALMDIPTGTYLEGRNGEHILNGGLASLTGVVGIGNNFKSTVMHYQMLTAMSRFRNGSANTYDTEVNIQEWHLMEMIRRVEGLHEEDVLQTGRWIITDKTMHTGDDWYAKQREFLEEKAKNIGKWSVDTPFWNRDRSGPLKMIMPTFSEIDSFTEFETSDVMDMQDKNDLGESGGNTIHMRQGLAKLRLLMEAPRLNGQANNYLLMTAHIGKESTMQNAGPAGSVPIVKLKHLKNGDKIKGTTDKFTFITHNCWHAYNASPLMAADKNGPEYPRDSDDKVKLDTDLNTVLLRNLRSKSGPSGMAITLIVSQTEGVLPSLTEFHHIREQDYYGLEGSKINYALSLYPECKLGRTTVRSKIDEDAKLRRALNITSEMCQMSYMWHHLDELMCTPKELYDSLKAKGYDWDILLNTRGWWTTDTDHPLPFLSTMDLLLIRAGKYHPYWYPIKLDALKAAA